MGRYFEYRDWDIEELCDSIRNRIADSKKIIPPIVKKQGVSIIFKTSENSYSYPHHFNYNYRENKSFETKEECLKCLDNTAWVEKIGDNMWIDIQEKRTYTDKDGNEIPYHYEIHEYEYEQYEDGEHYTLYSDEEKKMLSDALYHIEKARIYMQVYDHCSDQGSFGKGSFSDELKEELDKFEKNYNEEPRKNEDE